MRKHAVRTVFNTVIKVYEIASALVSVAVQRAVAESAVKSA